MLVLLFWPQSHLHAQPVTPSVTEQTEEGKALRFTAIDLTFNPSETIPTSGWKAERAMRIFSPGDAAAPKGGYHSLWGRVRFGRAQLDAGPLALFTSDNREQLVVYLNGQPLFRNFSRASDDLLSWYSPYLIPLPQTALKQGVNEIVIHAQSKPTVGVGALVIGPHHGLQAHYLQQYFWRITGPAIANFAMLVLGLMALLLWLVRRDEDELLWLALAAGLWFTRNYHYFGSQIPISAELFNGLTLYSSYFASAASAAFCLSFLRMPNSNRTIAILFGFGVLLSLAHWFFGLSSTWLFLAATLVGLVLGIYGVVALVRRQSRQHGVLASLMLLLPILSIHDMGRFNFVALWDGLGFYTSPYLGFIFCIAFLSAFGQRALGAFSELEAVNAGLEKRVAEAREELAASEEKRRELEVGQAVSGERARLMQEMHDGIGSNVIAALAVARQQKQPASTIKTLNRVLTDLKITVDSLEPVEGDMIALIGNLRHRMARDLRDAGVSCKWDAQACDPLPWLDASNALHVLRIFQEAIGNVLTHSGANEMRIGCGEAERGGVPGIAAYVADNGSGFDSEAADAPGKGLTNMQDRARSLHGVLERTSRAGEGTVVTLWLPYSRLRTH